MKEEGIFYFDPKDKIYNDHFPGNPIVPGTLIVNSFLEITSKLIPEETFSIAKNFKFKHFVIPGEYKYSVELNKDKLKCELKNLEEKVLVTGSLLKC